MKNYPPRGKGSQECATVASRKCFRSPRESRPNDEASERAKAAEASAREIIFPWGVNLHLSSLRVEFPFSACARERQRREISATGEDRGGAGAWSRPRRGPGRVSGPGTGGSLPQPEERALGGAGSPPGDPFSLGGSRCLLFPLGGRWVPASGAGKRRHPVLAEWSTGQRPGAPLPWGASSLLTLRPLRSLSVRFAFALLALSKRCCGASVVLLAGFSRSWRRVLGVAVELAWS